MLTIKDAYLAGVNFCILSKVEMKLYPLASESICWGTIYFLTVFFNKIRPHPLIYSPPAVIHSVLFQRRKDNGTSTTETGL